MGSGVNPYTYQLFDFWMLGYQACYCPADAGLVETRHYSNDSSTW
jgi:hypothetical protein